MRSKGATHQISVRRNNQGGKPCSSMASGSGDHEDIWRAKEARREGEIDDCEVEERRWMRRSSGSVLV